ncbi:hypothetical protein ACSW29_01850 [Rhodococcus sp. GB-02]
MRSLVILIFAVNGPKPEFVLRDGANNDIEIVRNGIVLRYFGSSLIRSFSIVGRSRFVRLVAL